jgi:hypothetical protein
VSSVAPTQSQIRAQVAFLRERQKPHERVIAIYSPSRWDGPDVLVVRGESIPIRQCNSVLQFREALLEFEGRDSPLVVLTSLSAEDLGSDIAARLRKGKPIPLRSWETVRGLFQAREIDPRLMDKKWIAEMLLEESGDGYPAVHGGVLDEDTAWSFVLKGRLGMEGGRPDLVALLRWSMGATSIERFADARVELKEGLRERLRDTAGEAGVAVLDSITSGYGKDAAVLGLACSVVFAEGETESVRLQKASVRLEKFWGGHPISVAAGRSFARASESVIEDMLERGGLGDATPWLQRADRVLAEVEALEDAVNGRLSLTGFEQRLTRFATALEGAVDAAVVSVPPELEQAKEAVVRHGLAPYQENRVARIEMALRLVRWLSLETRGTPETPSSFEGIATSYAEEGGFVDWARTFVSAGDGHEKLASAYGKLLGRVTGLREKENKHFAELFREWTAAGSPASRSVLVEGVLTKIVAPLAASAPVLLLVVDGMSVAVYREIVEDLVREGWFEMVDPTMPRPLPVIAAIPSITEVSRTSLLCGRLCSGNSAGEKEGFGQHPDLVARTARKQAPLLFHKSELTEAGEAGLTPAVRKEIVSPERPVVGVVINAVDDQLGKGDQILPRWNIDFIRPLRPLLHAAREAGRVLVLLSDHGHVLERGSELRLAEDGQRWRRFSGEPDAREIVLTGSRVVSPAGERVVMPWSEGLRYTVKQNGYHGGATPQEVVIPLGVFSAGAPVEGWTEVASAYPGWWLGAAAPEPTVGPPIVMRKRKLKSVVEDLPLFQPAAMPLARLPGWIDALLASPTLSSQMALAGRVAPGAERLRGFLMALDQRGGKLTRAALAQNLGLPLLRMNGIIVTMRRVLNVDGYPVLAVDEDSDSIELNKDLLRAQFEISS